MTDPSIEALEVLAAHQGIQIAAWRLREVALASGALQRQLSELRHVHLDYLDHIEPAHVSAWIARGGSSGNATADQRASGPG